MVMANETGLTSLLTVKQVAKELSMSKCSVYRWAKRGWLPYVRLPNGNIRIMQISVDRILAGK